LAAALGLVIAIAGLLTVGTAPAWAGFDDDRFDGNIFALYAGNGALVPPRTTLADSIQRHKPALLVFFVDDSSDCKQFSPVVSQLQGFYGKVVDFIPINVDSLPVQASYSPTEPGYYYAGVVPQTVVINKEGKVALNAKGKVAFEAVDDAFREVFDLLPRSESVPLRRRMFNEFNSELTEQAAPKN
jgi:thiol-disulfide isomerase/thioredoxin